MIKFPDLSGLPKYNELRKSQPSIDNENFMPILINNIFNDNQIKQIKYAMNNFPKEKIRVQNWGGQGIFDEIVLDKNIYETILNVANKNFNEELVMAEISFVRYSPAYGYEVKLFPHYDTRPEESMVLDIQIESNEKWGIFVEGSEFNLKNNQALLFSGTQQIHWRENKKLSKNAQIDMVFCWLRYKNPRMTKKENIEIMEERERVLLHETGISNKEIKYIND